MQRSTHIFFAITLTSIHLGYAENKQSIATAEFLSVLAKNVATVLSPTLVGELHDGRPNRTAVNTTIITPIPITTKSTESPEDTTESLKLSTFEADTVRSAQTQSEVRPGSNGFPFNYDENNYRYNYPGLNSQVLSGRPEFSPGPFNNPGYYNNADLYRGYPGQSTPEGNSQRVENIGGVSPVETVGDGQTGRSPDSLDPTGPNFDRFRNFERFPFNNQSPGGPGNFANSAFSAQRPEGRFGQPSTDLFNPSLTGNPNFANNPNFQNSIGNNYPRNSFQQLLGDPYQQRQQGFRSNNYDFLPSQRFQNPYDNYPRSLQRGPNFPGFYPVPYSSELRDAENFVPPSTRIDVKKNEEASPSELSAKSEILKNGNTTNSTTNNEDRRTPEILSVQGRIRFGRLLLPTLDDYDDLRFRPDDFREYLFVPNNNTANATKNSGANDI